MLGNIKQDTDSNNTKTSIDSNNVALVSVLKVKKEKKKNNMSCMNTEVQFIDNNNDIAANVITDNNDTGNNNYTNSNNIIKINPTSSSSSSSSSSIQNTKNNTSCTNKLKSSLKHNSSSSSLLAQKNDLKLNIIYTASTIQSPPTTIPTTTILEIPGKDIIKKESNKINSEINYTNPQDTIILNNILTLNLQIKNKLIEECNIIIELILRKRYRNISECKLFEIGGTRKRKLLDSSLSVTSTGIVDITSGLTVATASSATSTRSTSGSMKIEKSNDFKIERGY
jgi:hypothetical protein